MLRLNSITEFRFVATRTIIGITYGTYYLKYLRRWLRIVDVDGLVHNVNLAVVSRFTLISILLQIVINSGLVFDPLVMHHGVRPSKVKEDSD